MPFESDVSAERDRHARQRARELVELASVVEPEQQGVPGLRIIGEAFDQPAQAGQSLVRLAIAYQSQAQGDRHVEIAGMLFYDRRQGLRNRVGPQRLGIVPYELQEQLRAIARVGLLRVERHRQGMRRLRRPWT